jgi:hypothetical protein
MTGSMTSGSGGHSDTRREGVARAELRGRIEPFLFEHLPREPIALESVDPAALLTRSRLSLGTKLLVLRSLKHDDDALNDLYAEHISLFSLGTFSEPGNPEKQSLEAYLAAFRDILRGMRARGFDDSSSVVPLAHDGTLLNGEHRVACAIALGIPKITCVRTSAISGDFGARFFRARGASTHLMDLSALAFLESSPRTHTALIWPSATGNDDRVHGILGDVVYSKSVPLTWNGARNFVAEVYRGENWLGSPDEGFPGADSKAAACFASDGPVRLVLFQPTSGEYCRR